MLISTDVFGKLTNEQLTGINFAEFWQMHLGLWNFLTIYGTCNALSISVEHHT